VPTWSETGNLGSDGYSDPGDSERSARFLLAFFWCLIIRKYIRMVINAEAIILPTIARAAWVAVTAAD
jgi:hypothetical protein